MNTKLYVLTRHPIIVHEQGEQNFSQTRKMILNRVKFLV